MNKRYLILLCTCFLILCITSSCEPYQHVLFNGEKNVLQRNSSGCRIEIEAGVTSVYRVGFKITALDDGVKWDINEWMVELSNANKANFGPINENSFYLENNEKLEFLIISKEPLHKRKIPFVFPKSENILCNGRPIFSESVEYVLESGRRKFTH